MIFVIATAQLKPGVREAYIAGAKTAIAETRKEKGNIAYDLHVSVTDPDTVVFVERWESLDNLKAHGTAPHMKIWRELSAPMKVAPTRIEVISDATVEVR